MPTPLDVLCARLVVQKGISTEEKVRECLDLQAQNRRIGFDESLVNTMLKRGYIGEEQARQVERDLALAQFVRAERLFAKLCVERGVIDAETAKQALERQRVEGYRKRIGEALIEMKKLDRARRDELAAEQVKRLEEEDIASRRAEVQGAPAPPPPVSDEAPAPIAAAASGDAVAAFARDRRRFGSGEHEVMRQTAAVAVAIEGFTVEDRLGQGAVGVVYRARPVAGGPPVALKVLPPSLTRSPELFGRFRQAWSQATSLDHPSLVKVGKLGRSGDVLYYTMELVDGETLGALVERGGPLPADRARAIFRDVAQGLAHAHKRGVLHGSVRPSNILVARAGGAKIADAAIGRAAPRAVVAESGPSEASLYASPEELAAAAAPDPRDDVYSFGLSLYYALTGRPAFRDASPTLRLGGPADPRDADPRCDAFLAEIVARATRPSRNERYLDGAELLREFDPVATPAPANVPDMAFSADAPTMLQPNLPTSSSNDGHTLYAPAPAAPTPSELAAAKNAFPGVMTPVRGAPIAQFAREDDPGSGTMVVPPPVPMPDASRGAPRKTRIMDAAVDNSVVASSGARRQAPPPSPAASRASAPRRHQTGSSREPIEDLTGRVILNRYRLLERLGEGGMGVVYKAEHTLMAKTIAIKILHASLVKSDEKIARFKREVLAMAQFTHRNVVRIYDAGTTEDGLFYMAMELVEGRDLGKLLDEGPVPLPRAVAILRQVLKAIGEAHKKGIVHRDLKPENILLTRGTAGEEVVKVMDFGIAKILESDSQSSADQAARQFHTMERMVLGTPEYMSPEQASGSAVDHRSDIYSLGVIAYEMLVGRLPFDADSPVGFIGKHIVDPPLPFDEARPGHGVAPKIEAFVMKALEKDPIERWDGAESMLRGLEEAAPAEIQAAVSMSLAGKQSNDDDSARVPAQFPAPGFGSADVQAPGRPVSDRLAPAASSRAPSPAAPPRSPPPQPAPLPQTKPVAPPKKSNNLIIIGALGVIAVFVLVAVVTVVILIKREPFAKKLVAAHDAALAAAGKDDYAAKRASLQQLVDKSSGEEHLQAEKALAECDAKDKEARDEQKRTTDFADALQRARSFIQSRDPVNAAEQLKRAGELARTDKEKADVEELVKGNDAVANDRKRDEEEKRAAGLLASRDYPGAIDHLKSALLFAHDDKDKDRLNAKIADATADSLSEGAKRAHDARNYDEEVRELQDALKARPNDAGLKARLDEAKRLQRERSGEDHLRRAEDRFRTATGLEQAGSWDEARASYEEAKSEAAKVSDPAAQKLIAQIGERLAKIDDLKKSWPDLKKLPAMPGEKAPESDLAAALEARRKYLKDFPAGAEVERVTKEAEQLETVLKSARGSDARKKLDAAVAKVRGGLAKDDVAGARAALDEVGAAAAGVPEGEKTLAALKAEVDARETLQRDLKKDFVWVKPGKRPAGFSGPDLDGFFIGKGEVTNTEWLQFCLGSTEKRWPDGWVDSEEGGKLWASQDGDAPSQPVAGVSFEDAKAYCVWKTAHAPTGVKIVYRLPTEAEWERAARGDGNLQYPFVGTISQDLPIVWSRFSRRTSPANTSADVWAGGASPFGALHMAGNVAEIVDDEFRDTDGGKLTGTRCAKGGSFLSTNDKDIEAGARVKIGLQEKKNDVGFRVLVEVKKD